MSLNCKINYQDGRVSSIASPTEGLSALYPQLKAKYGDEVALDLMYIAYSDDALSTLQDRLTDIGEPTMQDLEQYIDALNRDLAGKLTLADRQELDRIAIQLNTSSMEELETRLQGIVSKGTVRFIDGLTPVRAKELLNRIRNTEDRPELPINSPNYIIEDGEVRDIFDIVRERSVYITNREEFDDLIREVATDNFLMEYESVESLATRNPYYITRKEKDVYERIKSEALQRIEDRKEKRLIREQSMKDGTFMKAPNGQDTQLTEEQWLTVRTNSFKQWFGDWLNDPQNSSKVVDNNGEPLVLYHGSREIFNSFDPKITWENAFHFGVKPAAKFFADIEDSTLMPVFLNIRNLVRTADEFASGKFVRPDTLLKMAEDFKEFGNKAHLDQDENAHFVESYEAYRRGEDVTSFLDSEQESSNKSGQAFLEELEARYNRLIDEGIEPLEYDRTKDIDGAVYTNLVEFMGEDSYVVLDPTNIKSASDNIGQFSTEDSNIRKQEATIPDADNIAPLEVAQQVVDRLKETGLTENVEWLNSEEIATKLSELGEANTTTVPNGFVHNNIVYLNTGSISLDTPIHEFYHLFSDWLKVNRADVYNRGIELVKQEIEADISDIGGVISFVRESQPELEGDSLAEEVLAELVGREGVNLLNTTQNDTGILNYLKEVWSQIRDLLGIRNNTPEQVSNMTLQEYAEASARQLLSGERMLSQELQNIRSVTETNGTFMRTPDGSNTNLTTRQWLVTRTKRFKDWFGNWENNPETSSKVLGANGEPLVVHLTNSRVLKEVGIEAIGNTNLETIPGIYFTTDSLAAQGVQEASIGVPSTVDAFLSIKNPMEVGKKVESVGQVRSIVSSLVDLEARGDGSISMSYREGFLSHLVDTYELSRSQAIDEAAKVLYESNEGIIDIINSLSGIAVNINMVTTSVVEGTGYDGVVLESIDYDEGLGGTTYIVWSPSQVKLASANIGSISSAYSNSELIAEGIVEETLGDKMFRAHQKSTIIREYNRDLTPRQVPNVVTEATNTIQDYNQFIVADMIQEYLDGSRSLEDLIKDSGKVGVDLTGMTGIADPTYFLESLRYLILEPNSDTMSELVEYYESQVPNSTVQEVYREDIGLHGENRQLSKFPEGVSEESVYEEYGAVHIGNNYYESVDRLPESSAEFVNDLYVDIISTGVIPRGIPTEVLTDSMKNMTPAELYEHITSKSQIEVESRLAEWYNSLGTNPVGRQIAYHKAQIEALPDSEVNTVITQVNDNIYAMSDLISDKVDSFYNNKALYKALYNNLYVNEDGLSFKRYSDRSLALQAVQELSESQFNNLMDSIEQSRNEEIKFLYQSREKPIDFNDYVVRVQNNPNIIPEFSGTYSIRADNRLETRDGGEMLINTSDGLYLKIGDNGTVSLYRNIPTYTEGEIQNSRELDLIENPTVYSNTEPLNNGTVVTKNQDNKIRERTCQ